MSDSHSTHSTRHDDLLARLHAIRDVHKALELVEALVEPANYPRVCLTELDRQRFAAMLRLLNNALSERLGALYGLHALMKASGR